MTSQQLIDSYGGFFETYRAYFNGEMNAEQKECFEEKVACSYLYSMLKKEGKAESGYEGRLCGHGGFSE